MIDASKFSPEQWHEFFYGKSDKDYTKYIEKPTRFDGSPMLSNMFPPGEYVLCGNCHTIRSGYVIDPFSKKLEWKTMVCKCRKETEMAVKTAQGIEQNRRRMVDLNRMFGFDLTSIKHMRFSNDDGGIPNLTSACQLYVDKFDQYRKNGEGLLFMGSVGVGKTFMAGCIANELLDKGYSVYVTNMATLTNLLGDFKIDRNGFLRKTVNRCDLFVLDDLGAERDTSYMAEIVHQVVDARYRSKLPMVVTTNLTREQMKNPKDITAQRVYSRLLEMCRPCKVVGEDRRQTKRTGGPS